MTEHLISLAESKYWIFSAVAIVALVPVAGARTRLWILALVNVLFIRLYLTLTQVIVVLVALAAITLLTRLISLTRFRIIATVGICLPILALFVLHKFPALHRLDDTRVVLGTLATIGFSFVTLRIFDLVRAVYESHSRPPTYLETINYLLPFHMLAAGPIQSYADFLRQLSVPPSLTPIQAFLAVERIALGLFKKYVVALAIDRTFFTGFSIPGLYFVWEAQLFYLWLFLDFSGLSDIAVGIGTLMGVATPENFNHPYFARNMIDFWGRWHISLSQFIRRNIFIPIQMTLLRRMRGHHALLCASIAFMIAFLLCGLWHQGTLRYLLWGGIHAAGLIITNLYRVWLTRILGPAGVKIYLANPWIRFMAIVVTFEFVAFSLVFVEIPIPGL